MCIGAMTTHYQIESSTFLKQFCPLLPECAAHIGDVQVRNKGTIGGSVAHSDPAGDWPAAIIALKAEMIVASKNGERTVKAESFCVDLLRRHSNPARFARDSNSQSQTAAPDGFTYKMLILGLVSPWLEVAAC